MFSDKKLPKDLERPALEDETLYEEIKNLSLDEPSKTKFVINTIAYVPELSDDSDSSSDERDTSFSDADFNFDPENKSTFPFTTTPKKYVRKKELKFEELSNANQSDSVSTIIAPFLKKISEKGFKDSDKDKLTTSISTCIAINRMKSLSTRKNNSLKFELKSQVKTDIRYEKIGVFWKCEWYDKSGVSVEENLVRKFYKQLKRIDPKKAQEFIREMEENNIDVPYQELREYTKNHEKTKKLVREFREKVNDANVYLSLIDCDTVDFNGIYGAYLRIVRSSKVVPTVMSTGYKYSKDDSAYHFASKIDRKIRVITAHHIPLGVYYPEPNTCVLIPQTYDTLPESFIAKTGKRRKKGNLEMTCLLKDIQRKRENTTFIFSGYNPLITTIPDRAKLTRAIKSTISFSPEFVQGASPTKNDIISCKQVAQSSFYEYVWLTNLFINDGIRYKTYDLKDYVKDPERLECSKKILEIAVNKSKKSEYRSSAIDELKKYIDSDVVDVMTEKYVTNHCKSLISNIRSSEETTEECKYTISTLKKYIIDKDVDAIVNAIKKIKQYIKQVSIRSDDEDRLFPLLTKESIQIGSFSEKKIRMLAQKHILKLVEEGIINLQHLIGLKIKILEYICYDKELIEILENKTIDFCGLLKLLENNFSKYMEDIEQYSILDILDK